MSFISVLRFHKCSRILSFLMEANFRTFNTFLTVKNKNVVYYLNIIYSADIGPMSTDCFIRSCAVSLSLSLLSPSLSLTLLCFPISPPVSVLLSLLQGLWIFLDICVSPKSTAKNNDTMGPTVRILVLNTAKYENNNKCYLKVLSQLISGPPIGGS